MDITKTPLIINLKLHKWRTTNPAPTLILILLIIGYIVAIMTLHVFNYNRFRYGFDLSFYEQSVWNTVHGRFLQVSATDFSNSLLGTDAILILALLAPFYALLPSPFTLLFLETIVVALGALPLYWLAQVHLKSKVAGLLFAATYLLLLPVENGNLYEWRERPMAMGFLLFAFYFYQGGRFRLFMLSAALTLCCRPENGLLLVMLAFYGFLQGYHKNKKFGWSFILGPALLGLIWFGLVVAVVIPASSTGGSFALAQNYGPLGSTPGEIAKNLLTDPLGSLTKIFTPDNTFKKLVYLPLLLLPFLFLPLISPTILLLALPAVVLNILSIRDIQYNPYDYHYQGSIIPWLLIATLFTIEKICYKQDQPRSHFKLKLFGLCGAVLAMTLLLSILGIFLSATNNPTNAVGNNPIKKTFANAPRTDLATGEAILKEIPPDAPLAISNVWAAHVPMREGLWLFGIRKLYSVHPAQNADYIFADQRDLTDEEKALLKSLEADPTWQILDNQGNYILLKRIKP
jgi:uncharacterized membrane protein